MVDCETFLNTVGERIGNHSGPDERATRAAQATRATLQTLAERIDRGEARRVAAQLPPELAPWIATPTPAEGFDVDEFVWRVAAREPVDPITAPRHVAAVLAGLAEAVEPEEWTRVVSELPRSFASLFPRGPYVPVIDLDTFIGQVAARVGLSFENADRATDAVLEALAQRIAGGEVEDLIVRLPPGLHPPLKRGRASVRGEAQPWKLDKFIHTIADREGACIIEAVLHARAVFSVLRDTVGEPEFRDIMVQLPREYLEALT
jgi:uncharacterized protein (DUF2267 family)